MVSSAAEIRALILGDPILSAIPCDVAIVDRPVVLRRPLVDVLEVQIQRFPTLGEFEATWSLQLVDHGTDLLGDALQQMAQLLPGFQWQGSELLAQATVTALRTARTVTAPEPEPAPPAAAAAATQDALAALEALRDRLLREIAALRQDVEDRLLITPAAGQPGQDGKPGKDGRPGRDGRDLVATSAHLADLLDVAEAPPGEGEVLTYSEGLWRPAPSRASSWHSLGGGGGGQGSPLAFWEETEEGHLLPLADAVQDLGSPERQIRSIHVAAQTLYIDRQPLSVNGQAQLTYRGEPLALASQVIATGQGMDGGTFTEPEPEPPSDPNTFV